MVPTQEVSSCPLMTSLMYPVAHTASRKTTTRGSNEAREIAPSVGAI